MGAPAPNPTYSPAPGPDWPDDSQNEDLSLNNDANEDAYDEILADMQAFQENWHNSLTSDNVLGIQVVYYPWTALIHISDILNRDPAPLSDEELAENKRKALLPQPIADVTLQRYTESRAYLKLTEASVTAALGWNCMNDDDRYLDTDYGNALAEAYEKLLNMQSGIEDGYGDLQGGVTKASIDLTSLTFRNLQDLQVGQYVLLVDKDPETGVPYEEDPITGEPYDPKTYTVSQYFYRGRIFYDDFKRLYVNTLRGLCLGEPTPPPPKDEKKCYYNCAEKVNCDLGLADYQPPDGTVGVFNYEQSGGCGVGGTDGTAFTAHKFGTTVKKIEVWVGTASAVATNDEIDDTENTALLRRIVHGPELTARVYDDPTSSATCPTGYALVECEGLDKFEPEEIEEIANTCTVHSKPSRYKIHPVREWFQYCKSNACSASDLTFGCMLDEDVKDENYGDLTFTEDTYFGMRRDGSTWKCEDDKNTRPLFFNWADNEPSGDGAEAHFWFSHGNRWNDLNGYEDPLRKCLCRFKDTFQARATCNKELEWSYIQGIRTSFFDDSIPVISGKSLGAKFTFEFEIDEKIAEGKLRDRNRDKQVAARLHGVQDHTLRIVSKWTDFHGRQ
jgi:hypothetical protein